MAETISEPVNRIDDFTDYYGKIVVKMIGAEGTQFKALDAITKVFTNNGVSSEVYGQALVEVAVQTAIQFNKDATSSAIELIRLEPEFELKAAQRDLTVRQTQGFDDNLLIKNVEKQGELAAFAVNANSASAQTTINDLKTLMAQLSSRVIPLDSGDSCPAITPITAIPTSVVATAITDTSITISWNAVSGATSYLVYKDGVLASTSGSVSFVDTGLTPNTKYSYSVKASINGIESNHTNAIVPKTSVGA